MPPSRCARAAVAAAAALSAAVGIFGASRDEPIRDPRAPGDEALVERGLVTLRLDPQRGAPPGECDQLQAGDLAVTVGGLPVSVTSVERVPRPERHWLLIDISESAEGRRSEAKRSAAEYVREVMVPGVDHAALLTVDEDLQLLEGLTSDPPSLAKQIEAIPAGGSSALRDGLDLVLRQIEGDRHEQLILYWTDGHDTQSLASDDDLLATLRRAPNATIFPIALLPMRMPTSGEPLVGPFLFDVAKRSGGEVFASANRSWLDQVRGWIARRFIVAFTPPEDGRQGLAMSVPGKRCDITVLPDPFARPDAVAGTAPPLPPSWLRWHAKQKKLDDPRCALATGPSAWDWPLAAEGDLLSGCFLDLVSAPGPLIRGRPEWRALVLDPVKIGSRQLSVAAPKVDALPASPFDVVDAIVPATDLVTDAPPAGLLEGAALLAQRTRIATSLFAARADYRAFALKRLAELAEDDLREIERDLHRSFPELPAAEVAAAARASRAGRRALEAARTPTDADLARVLAAWLGDVTARDLLLGWERRLLDARLAGEDAPEASQRWQRLRDTLSVPSRVRVVAPVNLVHDRERNLIGFWRIVLPRPEWFADRIAPSPPVSLDRPDDRVPQRPLGLWVLDGLAREGAPLLSLRARGYRCESLAYQSLDKPWRASTDQPYRRLRVTIALTAGEPGAAPARATIDAEVELRPDQPLRLVTLKSRVEGDDALRDALEAAALRLVPVQTGEGQTPTELPTQSKPLL